MLREFGVPICKVTRGWYKIYNFRGFQANIRLGRTHNGELGTKWYADIRTGAGDLKRYAGIWDTRRDAIEESIRIIKSL